MVVDLVDSLCAALCAASPDTSLHAQLSLILSWLALRWLALRVGGSGRLLRGCGLLLVGWGIGLNGGVRLGGVN